MTAPQLQFDPATHIYTDPETGEIVPSVTNILAPLTSYYRVPLDKLQKAADRGTAVHKLTEEWDLRGNSDEALPDCATCTIHNPVEHGSGCCMAELTGYLAGWIKFRTEHRFRPLEVEMRVHHQRHGYSGTLDRIGRLGSAYDQLALIDIKTSALVGPAMGAQLAAYLEAANSMYPNRTPIKRRFVVQLRADGTYALEEFTNPWDFPAFLGCLSLWHWQQSLEKHPEVRLNPPPLPRTPHEPRTDHLSPESTYKPYPYLMPSA